MKKVTVKALQLTMILFTLSRHTSQQKETLKVKKTASWLCPTDECFCLKQMTVDCTDLDLDSLPDFEGNNITVYDIIDGSYNPLFMLRAYGFRKVQTRSIKITSNIGSLKLHPRAFRGLENSLEELNLTKDGIVSLPPKLFRNMLKLKVIDLSQNKIIALTPNIVVGSHNFELLNLQSNRMKELSEDSLRGLQNVKRFNLAWNSLEFIHRMAFSDFVNLLILDLHANRIRDLQMECFLNLTHLKELDLASNRLPAIFPRMLDGLRELEELSLSSNQLLSTITANSLASLTNLKVLSLSNTKMSRLKSTTFNGLTNLRTLNLNNNGIQQLDDGVFEPLTSLRRVFLDGNNITTISPCVFGNNLKNLKTISLLGNSITCDCHLRWTALPVVPDVVGKCHEPPTIRDEEIRKWQKYAVCSYDDIPPDCKLSNQVQSTYPIKDLKPIWKYYL